MCGASKIKTVRIITGPWHNVVAKTCQQIKICGNIILSTVECGAYFVGSDTILVFKFSSGVFGGGTRLAMPKTTLRAGLIVLKSGSGATEGVLD